MAAMSNPKKVVTLLLLAVCVTSPTRAAGAVVINEFMAANNSFVTDPQGQYEDWIELHNVGDTPVDVGGMYLTDDIEAPTRWRIPFDNPTATTIAPGGFLVIWADNDVADGPLHAAFALSAGGEELALFDTDGLSLIDSVAFGEQTADTSYGRFPDATDNWRFMLFATPSGPNVGAYEGVVADTKFSRDRGFYDEPFDLTIACATSGALIYYCTDGSEPYVSGGRVSVGKAYTGPIRIARTTSLRAVAVKPGWMSSNTDTQTYIFPAQVASQSTAPVGFPTSWRGTTADYAMDPDVVNDPRYRDQLTDALLSLPSMSLVMTNGDLFDSSAGIYANPRSEGVSWERPCSMELIYPDGTKGMQVDCGVRIQGGYFRSNSACRKHSFRLLFKAVYGPTKLRYPLFGADAAQEFDTITLRAGANDGYTWNAAYETEQYTRDELGRRLQVATGNAGSHGMFVHLYVNGLYWGLYNPCERPDASFSATYYGGDKDNWDSIHDLSASNGSTTAWNQMVSLCRNAAGSNDAYQQLQGNRPDGTPDPDIPHLLDVPNYIDYLIVNLWGGNWDWPWKNWWAARDRSPGSTGFKFYCWDYENTMGNNRGRSPLNKNALRNNFSSAGQPHQHLEDNAEYRMLFADRVHRLFFNDGPLTTASLIARYDEMAATVEKAIITESARWGDQHNHPPLTQQQWYNERDWILNTYLPQRSDIVLQQFRSAGLYPYVNAPAFNVNGSYRHGGHVATSDRIAMTGAGAAVWFTVDGNDPRMPALAPPGDDGDDDDGVLVAENAAKRVLVPAGAVGDTWKTDPDFDDTAWLSGTGGVGYERSAGYQSYFNIDLRDPMYGQQTTCYIRIPFTLDGDPGELDAVQLRVRYDDGFIAYLNGFEIARRNFAGEPAWNSFADAQNSDGDAVNWEDIPLVDAADKLRQGENVLAIHGLNISTTSSDFLISVMLATGGAGTPQGGAVSPTAARYTGPLTLTKSARVKARALSGDTWSALSEAVFAVGPVAEKLRISEIMYHPAATGSPDDPSTEYVELTNIGGETIDLNLVKFTNGIDFTFGSFELAPGDYCLVVRNVTAFDGKYGAGFNIAGQYSGSLNNAGERIELRDAVGAVIHDFRFEDDWFDITDGQGFSLTVKDPAGDPNNFDGKRAWRPSAYVGGSPGYDDTGEVPELGSVVISELLANSVGNEPDWIELHNTTNQPIGLGGWFLSDDADLLTKYEIAAGIVLPASGYLVFDQDHHFDNRNDPGCHERFALSRDGETVYLHSGAQGELTGYSEQERFDASDPGVSLGRHLKSTGTYNFVALRAPTPGVANADPQVGPVVISEIMYHPAASSGVEYVELLNISDVVVTLYDADRDGPWRFTDDPDNPGIDCLFPTDEPVTLAPNEYLILTKDASLLTSSYTIPDGVQVFAWGAGNLANDGEKVQLSKPGAEDDSERHWIRVDRVVYSDGANPDEFATGVDPWPTEPDGQGSSLGRIAPAAYGNDPANWQAITPSPGSAD